jgi:KTSC domain-containing protein
LRFQFVLRLRPSSTRWQRKSRERVPERCPLHFLLYVGGFMGTHRFDGFTPISSGHLDGAKYFPMSRMLHIRFQNGYVYAVHGVSSEAYKEFMDAPSQGEHYHKFIKDQYHVERVR